MASPSWQERWTHPKDTVVIITGAGSGIGMATALLAAQQGYQVAGWDISEQGVLKTKELAGELASQIHPIVCDIADENAVKEAMAATEKIGKPHMLVNNAGPVAIGKPRSFLEMMDAAMRMISLPTVAFLETQPAQGASIVNISSVVGAVFGGGGSWYAAAKAGIVGYTKNLACEQKGHIRVNAIAPGGPIHTPRNDKFLKEGVFKKHLERNPTGRPGTADELANGVLFLLSPAASYINGHTLVIDGGLSIAE
ncbi:NAD(P)-binding protein [Thozetella sp. PMI_491]|nr:NAD(P)-binding protein [Thozetella sp. PMI_491]